MLASLGHSRNLLPPFANAFGLSRDGADIICRTGQRPAARSSPSVAPAAPIDPHRPASQRFGILKGVVLRVLASSAALPSATPCRSCQAPLIADSRPPRPREPPSSFEPALLHALSAFSGQTWTIGPPSGLAGKRRNSPTGSFMSAPTPSDFG